MEPTNLRIEFGPFLLEATNPGSRRPWRLSKGSTEIPFRADSKELDLLLFILRHPNRVEGIPKGEVIAKFWPAPAKKRERNFTELVRRLQVRLGDKQKPYSYIDRDDGRLWIIPPVIESTATPVATDQHGGRSPEEMPPSRTAPSRLSKLRFHYNQSRRSWLALGGVGFLLLVGALAVWLKQKISRSDSPTTNWRPSGKTLVVLDTAGNEMRTEEFDDFVQEDKLGPAYPRIFVADLDADGRPEMLFIHYPVDVRQNEIPDGDAELHCFRPEGRRLKRLWHKKFGVAFTTAKSGLFAPASRYQINVLGKMRKPGRGGGIIVAGGHRGIAWTYQVEVFTAQGGQVGKYLHPGWIFDMVIADLDGDGTEEIILGGVNSGYSELGFGATIVVLNSDNVEGQGQVPEGDDRQARDWPNRKEQAVVLVRDFAPSADNHAYCRVGQFTYAGGLLEAKVTKGSPELPYVYFRFDRELELVSIQPELNYEAQLLARSPTPLVSTQRQAFIRHNLGTIKYLWNNFKRGSQQTAG